MLVRARCVSCCSVHVPQGCGVASTVVEDLDDGGVFEKATEAAAAALIEPSPCEGRRVRGDVEHVYGLWLLSPKEPVIRARSTVRRLVEVVDRAL